MSPASEPPDEEEQDYDTGPFCRHWSHPADCDEPCATQDCGHSCTLHMHGACAEECCPCTEYTEKEE
jgi:hypothetical protein